MTTNVTVAAHCDENTEVEVELYNPHEGSEFHYLRNGEEREFYVYDRNYICISEITMRPGETPEEL